MKARNEFVRSGLQRAYLEKVKHKTLEVFCVSNVDYNKHSRKGHRDSAKATEIPALRTFCYAINARAQLAESIAFLLAKLPSLLGSARLWMERVLRADQEIQTKKRQDELLSYIQKVHTEVIDWYRLIMPR